MSQETIEKIFSRDKFSVPSYQRDYAWGKKNFEDLWEDLLEALDSKDSHFLGTIVVAPNKEDSKKFDIIDGQQRSTTIFMLLYALIEKSKYKSNYKIKYLLDKENNLKLELALQNQDFFKEILNESINGHINEKIKNKADTKGKRNLAEVFDAILDKTHNLDSNEVEKYIDKLKSMILMWLEEPNAGRAIRTFQSVNDRGVPLNLLDKLKSLLIYYSNTFCDGANNNLDSKINDTFGEIFRIFLQIEDNKYISNIGNQQFSESDIFRYHLGSIEFKEIGFLGHYRKSNLESYNTLKTELKNLDKDKLESFIRFYIDDLKIFFQTFLDLLNAIESNSCIFKLFLLEKVNPYFYNSIVRLKMRNELSDDLITLISKADMLFFKNQSSCDATAFNLIESALKGASEFRTKIITECKKLKNSINRLVNNLRDNAITAESFHYVFFEQNCTDMNAAALNRLVDKKKLTQEREHIIPISLYDNHNEAQIKALGFENIDDFGDYVNAYGNLLSLEKPLNVKATDKDLHGKASIYTESKLPFIRRFDAINFNKDALIKRNKQLESWLNNEFFKEFLD